jgi:hypothetical protein
MTPEEEEDTCMCHMRRRIHVLSCDMILATSSDDTCSRRRRIHACHMRRKIHACHAI